MQGERLGWQFWQFYYIPPLSIIENAIEKYLGYLWLTIRFPLHKL